VPIAEWIARNDTQRRILVRLVGSLRDADFAVETGAGWTVGAVLAHVAFWDRLVIGWIDDWEQSAPDYASAFRDWEKAVRAATARRSQPVNDEMLREWLVAPGPEVALECLAAAEAADAKVAAMPPDLAEAALSANPLGVGRPWVIDRATHRADHCGAIERALVEARG
jgi:hypothetical protein